MMMMRFREMCVHSRPCTHNRRLHPSSSPIPGGGLFRGHFPPHRPRSGNSLRGQYNPITPSRNRPSPSARDSYTTHGFEPKKTNSRRRVDSGRMPTHLQRGSCVYCTIIPYHDSMALPLADGLFWVFCFSPGVPLSTTTTVPASGSTPRYTNGHGGGSANCDLN